MNKKLVLIFSLIFFPGMLLSQNIHQPEKPPLSFQLWGNDEGLPASSISSIATSNNGYLWFSTGEGIVRFDGDRFTVYNPANTPQLSEKITHAIIRGNDGIIWSANQNEIIKIQDSDIESHRFDQGLVNHHIFAIHQFSDEVLWFGSGGDGIIEYNGGEFRSFYTNDGLPGNYIEDITSDQNGRIWIATRTGLGYYEDESFHDASEYPELQNVDIRTLLADSENRLWIGTQNRGIYLLDSQSGEIKNFNEENGLSGNMVISLIESAEGVIWAGTNGNGINKIDNGQIIHYKTADGLPSNMIFSLYESSDGIVWAGTAGAGLTQIRSSIVNSLTVSDGLSSNFILPIFQEENGTVWVGTGGEGLNKIENGEISHITTADGLSHNLVFSVYGQQDGTIWVGTTSGLNRIKDGEITTYSDADGLVHNSIHAIFEDSQNNLWIGGSGGGLHKYSDNIINAIDLPPGYSDAVWSSIFEDSGNNIWVGSHGFGALKITGDEVIGYHEDSGLPSDLVLDFYEDENEIVWIATRSGLVRYDGHDFETFTTDDGLLYNDFFRLLQDDTGTFWSCSNWGVQFFSADEIEAYRTGEIPSIPAYQLTRNDGMPSRECNGGVFPAGWKMSNGNIWFPTVGGTAIFNPAEIDIDTDPPPVLIESITAGDNELKSNSTPVLEAGIRAFEIKYTALEYKSPDRVRFRYRLKNFDDEWIDAGDRRIAYFTGLNPGNYTFEVMASKADENWSPHPASLSFTIEPFFYQTRLFYAFVLILLFFAGIAVQRHRNINLNRNQLQALVEQRTKELSDEINERYKAEKQLEKSLNEKTVMLTEIHHRVKNNLAVINALFQLQISKTENEDAVDLLADSQHRIQTIAAIHEHLYQTEYFSSIDMKVFLKKLLGIISSHYHSGSKEIKQTSDLDSIHLNINQAIPCGLILNEVITNVYKHAFKNRKKGEIYVSLKSENDTVNFIVSDDGVGMDEETIESGSTGMTLIRTLVTQLRGSYSVTSGKGTKFSISFEKEKE